jgi:hypothetical protein
LNEKLKAEGRSSASALVERDEPRGPLWLLDMVTAAFGWGSWMATGRRTLLGVITQAFKSSLSSAGDS